MANQKIIISQETLKIKVKAIGDKLIDTQIRKGLLEALTDELDGIKAATIALINQEGLKVDRDDLEEYFDDHPQVEETAKRKVKAKMSKAAKADGKANDKADDKSAL